MVQRIRESARQLFAERGYGSTTTREIARLADVSETLLFRYYGDKATLFDEVVIAPFQQLMDEFIAAHPAPGIDDDDVDRRLFVRRVYELFESNEAIFRALLAAPTRSAGEDAAPGLRGMTRFFRQSVDQLKRRYALLGMEPPFDLDVGVRIGMGMIAASVILRDSLFPDTKPSRESVIDVLDQFIARSLRATAI